MNSTLYWIQTLFPCLIKWRSSIVTFWRYTKIMKLIFTALQTSQSASSNSVPNFGKVVLICKNQYYTGGNIIKGGTLSVSSRSKEGGANIRYNTQHGRTLKAKKPVSTYYIIICISNVQIRQNGTETDYQHAKQWNCVLSLQHTQKLTLNGSLPYTEENYDTHKMLRNWSLHPSLLEMWNGAAASGNSRELPLAVLLQGVHSREVKTWYLQPNAPSSITHKR